MVWMGRAGMRSRGNPPDAHLPHIPLNPFAIHRVAVVDQLGGNPPRSIERVGGIEFVNAMFERHFFRIRPDGPVIEARAVETEQRRLEANR